MSKLRLVGKGEFDGLPERYRERASQIAIRVSEIDALLSPCQPEDIRDALIRLRGQFLPQVETDPADMANEFRLACRDLPAWAVAEATNDFLAGLVDNHSGRYMPVCAEFAKRARSIITPFLSEKSALRLEASRLVDRARDDARRHAIEMERQNPAVRRRVAAMVQAANMMPQKAISLTHGALTAEKQAALDRFKKRPEFVSKITQTKIGKGQE